MTLAQKFVVISFKEIKAIFLFYQNFAALFRMFVKSKPTTAVIPFPSCCRMPYRRAGLQ